MMLLQTTCRMWLPARATPPRRRACLPLLHAFASCCAHRHELGCHAWDVKSVVQQRMTSYDIGMHSIKYGWCQGQAAQDMWARLQRLGEARIGEGPLVEEHAWGGGSSSGEADTENSSSGSDTDAVSIADITGDFGASLRLEHSFPAHMQPPVVRQLRCYSAGNVPVLLSCTALAHGVMHAVHITLHVCTVQDSARCTIHVQSPSLSLSLSWSTGG